MVDIDLANLPDTNPVVSKNYVGQSHSPCNKRPFLGISVVDLLVFIVMCLLHIKTNFQEVPREIKVLNSLVEE